MAAITLRRSLLASSLAALLIISAGATLAAQSPATPAESQPPSPAPAEPPAEPVAADSPRSSMLAFIDAANAGQWQDAARYLSLTDQQRSRSPELAERLKGVIDSRRLIDIETISGGSRGQLDDGLPPELETVAAVPVGNREEPMRMVRTSDQAGTFWAFSPNTVTRIDGWYADLPDRWVRNLFSGTRFDVLLRPGFFGVLWWHWLLLPIIAFLAWAGGRGLRNLTVALIGAVTRRTRATWDDQMLASLGPPLTLVFSIVLFAAGCSLIQITQDAITLVELFTRPAMAFAVFWGLWRLVPVVTGWITSQPWAANSPSVRNMLSIATKIMQGLVLGLGVLAMIASLGYPVGTVLAGLGIGGLAVAFGAQKTVENVFGSVSLAIDQPFRIGDFVKVEDFVGTVEDIGLRSTRFRTLDRTLVSIPNGKLADQRLESFQARDRMRLATMIGVTYGTTQSQMRTILTGFERVLRAHPKIWPDAMVIKFAAFGASSLDIEIMAWFDVPTWGDFQGCREEVLLGFMGVVEAAGSSFAFPTRTVHLVREPAPGAPA